MNDSIFPIYNITTFFTIFIIVRIIHRLYYVFRGHKHHFYDGFRPRIEMNLFLNSETKEQTKADATSSSSSSGKGKKSSNSSDNNNNNNKLEFSEHSFKSKMDGAVLKYRRIGKGPKMVYLANGVGTDFFMWIPILKYWCKEYPAIFDEITLIAPSYRGLFGSGEIEVVSENEIDSPVKRTRSRSRSNSNSNSNGKNNNININNKSTSKSKNKNVNKNDDLNREKKEIEINISICAEDINQIMHHAKVSKFDTIIGWSLGAQTALTCCATYPNICEKLFLLNPSTGKTLHSAMQPFFQLPHFIGSFISCVIRNGIALLRPLTYSSTIWDGLQYFAYSTAFRIILEFLAFFGGYPPEQPLYFHEYMKDVFALRSHTRGLLDLIISLDAACPPNALHLPHKSVILTGVPDFLTGVYHGQILSSQMPNAKHIMFNMGSHFLLIEWPDLVAKELLIFLKS